MQSLSTEHTSELELGGSTPADTKLARLDGADDRRPLQRRARGLGWFSVALGLSQIVMPDAVASLVGVRRSETTRTLMRALGMRELVSGLAILGNVRPTGWMWGRVAGDAMDLGLLGAAFFSPKNDQGKVAIAAAAVAGVSLFDAVTAAQLSAQGPTSDAGREAERIKRTAAVTIGAAQSEVERAWETMRGEAPTGHGEPKFSAATGGRGTEVRVEHGMMRGRVVEAKLRRLKQLVEVGEVVHSDASIHRGLHPAQPSKDPQPAKGKDVLR